MKDLHLTRLRNIKGLGTKRLSHILEVLEESNQTFDVLFSMSSVELTTKFKLPQNVAEAMVLEFKKDIPTTEGEDETLASKGIILLQRGTDKYPKQLEQRLGNKAPKTLYAWGNLELLEKPAVGFCGSRSATDKGIAVTEDAARQIAELGWVVVSGHARGVDSTAHQMALEYGIGTIIVAPQGILDFKLRQELKRIAKPNQVLIISEFPPKARWNVGYAMTRNKTIIGLSDAMVLVEAREEGGTFEAGKEALRLKVPLYVAHYLQAQQSYAGNEYFLKRGAKPLRKSQITEKANIEALKIEVNNAVKKEEISVEMGQPEQISLF